VVLLIFDETNKEINAIALNRDSMVEMPMLDENGRRKVSFFGQLTFAHSIGNGLEESCENTVWTVSDLHYGAEIDYYFAMNMGAISKVNDAVGGVTIHVTEDFSKVDPSIPMGRVTLMGQQAINYVRTRKNVGDQLNISRIQRQKDYIQGFMSAFDQATKQNTNFMVSTYEEISEYMVTDCSVNAINGMLSRYKDFPLRQIVTPEGENVLGNEFYEFHVDTEALDALILELFYRPK
jgi:LCP family protein required for cell wall assembly